MEDEYCTDCKMQTKMAFDHAAGDTICRECGAVMESWYIDETAEYRTFQNDWGNDHDPVRVGGPTNPLLAQAGGLFTRVSKAPANKNSDIGDNLSRLPSRSVRDHDYDRLQASLSAIGEMAERMELVKTIQDRASEMFVKLEDQKSATKKNKDALMAACIYIACRQAHAPRSPNEISTITNGVTKKEIGRAINFVIKQLQIEMGETMEMESVQAGDYLKRFCSQLLMSKEQIKAVQETVKRSEDFDIRRNPKSIAASIIYMISQLSADDSKRRSLREISLVTTVAEGTIRDGYKDLFAYSSRIIPEWFAKGKDLNPPPVSNSRKRKNSAQDCLGVGTKK
ncbi:OLC1v1022054C1 [Oldenlandia corymbosa var. corymbosa]|uniref:OLC1v1022054C1 n=1 Tax=Oldenlandia corymbosa var. corymbosa TaxID=529605 RepID=A0AAV1BX17_OLDCO|nr:OLC1v1022054C1 [Oldenlandia corymbosa var. corymbosa]